MRRLILIDSFGVFFRLFYAMSGLKSRDGKASGMVSGFASFIAGLGGELQKIEPTRFEKNYLVFALDSGGPTFRSEILADYKANRKSPPDDLKAQLPVCMQMIEQMGFCAGKMSGYEADDIIASFVKSAFAGGQNEDLVVRIFSHDKDLYQLINERVSIISPTTKTIYDAALCEEKFGVLPHQIRDFLAICGDSADNIPGIKGIGDKGAKKLLNEFKSLDKIYENIDKIGNERTKKLLLEGREMGYKSLELATLFDGLEVPDLGAAEVDLGAIAGRLNMVRGILEEYSLGRILRGLGAPVGAKIADSDSAKNTAASDPAQAAALPFETTAQAATLPFEAIMIDDDSELDRITAAITPQSIVAFDTETTGLNIRGGDGIVGFSFCLFDDLNRAYYVPLNHTLAPKQASADAAKRAVERIFRATLVGQNIKFDLTVIKEAFGIAPAKKLIDTMVLAWLDEPESPKNLDALALKWLNHTTIKFEDIVPKNSHFGHIDPVLATKYAAEDAWVSMRLFLAMTGRIEAQRAPINADFLALAAGVEMPFISVLWQMEGEGIGLNTQKMAALIAKNAAQLSLLNRQIIELIGTNFNLNSPKQLGEILFERLGLPSAKKTKTGYSTDESVLLGLKEAHPAIAPILQYRELAKLQGTYCEPLLKLAQSSAKTDGQAGELGGLFASPSAPAACIGRVFSSFLQTGTATGRLASKSPNLQNIPARGQLAKEVRGAFEAGEGRSLISIDYSQIELRLLAHFSGDDALISAFEAGEDIHARTAKELFGKLNADNRQIAKSINFGLIYGMGANRLSENLGIDKKQAKEHIERYFEAFGSVRAYLEEVRGRAKMDGFVRTILGRRRYFDYSRANERTAAAFNREAVNTVFQGSAADIIKIAMNKIFYGEDFSGGDDLFSRVGDGGFGGGGDFGGGILSSRAKMILQIHDELIFEVRDDIAADFAAAAKGVMERALMLKVPLIANASIAKNWGDLK